MLVATHMNTHCLHNHFVINAVSYVDGKKYEQRRSQYAELRAARRPARSTGPSAGARCWACGGTPWTLRPVP